MTVADWWGEYRLRHPEVAEKASRLDRAYGVFRVVDENRAGNHPLEYSVSADSQEDAVAFAEHHAVENPGRAYCVIPVFSMKEWA